MPYNGFNQEITMSLDGNPMTPGGVMMAGTWFNRMTGDSFTVMDSYFEDNNFRVKTTDGRVLDYNTFQDYVQVDPKELKGLKESFGRPEPKAQDPLTAPVKVVTTPQDEYADLLAEDPLNDVLTRPLCTSPRTSTPAPAPAPVSGNHKLIDKALRHKSIPTMKVTFEWPDFPKKQIEALTDVIDIPIDEIIEYVYTETMESMKDEVEGMLKEYIGSKIKS